MTRALPLLLGMVVVGCTTPQQQRGTTGPEVYATTCAACHATDGLGVNEAFPPLQDSPWVNLPDSLLIRLTLRGLRGPFR